LEKILRPRWLGLVVLVLAVLLTVNYLRPVAAAAATLTVAASSQSEGSSPTLPWPDQGQGAIGAEGAGVIAASPSASPQPIASVAKVMTALVALDEKPLKEGEQGPVIPITADDVTGFQQEKANGESVVQVQAGEQLTEYQALQGLLIPSGNNVAALLGRWASGSLDAHVQRMNARAKALGLSHTTFTDVSGLSEKTVSVPADLVRLGQEALKNPVIASVVQQEQAVLPIAGTLPNVNYALGQEGIFGIKTGNITAGGAIYLFAGNVQLSTGTKIYLVGAVQGLSTLDGAFNAAKTLLRAARTSLQALHVVSKNQSVGRYDLPWGGGSDLVATQDLDVLVWAGTVVRTALRADAATPPVSPRTTLGSLHVTAGDAVFDLPVANADQLNPPGRLARLTRVTW
jgi:D-alanyl-D-alanine carboxypeptidase (penicillin-binding protein 5/6)